MREGALSFGLRNGVISHVDEVPNGLDCGCFCPACGERLVAKQGARTIHHFAHEGGSDCNGGLQTTLHLAAKALLVRDKKMLLPPLIVTASALDSRGLRHEAQRTVPSKLVIFDEVLDEVSFGSMIPDIIGKIGARTLLIEIAVHHFVNEAKLLKIKKSGVACIEVDLSSAIDDRGWDSLKDALIDATANKVWLSNPKAEQLMKVAQLEANDRAARSDRRHKSLEKEIEQAHSIRKNEIPGFHEAIAKLEKMRDPMQVERESERMESTGPTEAVWIWAAKVLGISWRLVPDFVGVEVPGESAFLVHRKVWQAAIFTFFVVQNVNQTFGSNAVVHWCLTNFPRRTDLYVLQKNWQLLTPEQQVFLPGAAKAVHAYLRVLTNRGFTRNVGGRNEILGRQGFKRKTGL